MVVCSEQFGGLGSRARQHTSLYILLCATRGTVYCCVNAMAELETFDCFFLPFYRLISTYIAPSCGWLVTGTTCCYLMLCYMALLFPLVAYEIQFGLENILLSHVPPCVLYLNLRTSSPEVSQSADSSVVTNVISQMAPCAGDCAGR